MKFIDYAEFISANIPPRAGRCIEIGLFTDGSIKKSIPPRAGRCIEIKYEVRPLSPHPFLPVRGGVLKFSYNRRNIL